MGANLRDHIEPICTWKGSVERSSEPTQKMYVDVARFRELGHEIDVHGVGREPVVPVGGFDHAAPNLSSQTC